MSELLETGKILDNVRDKIQVDGKKITDLDVIPVQTMEDVAMNFQSHAQNIEYFLLRVRTSERPDAGSTRSTGEALTPPPFRKRAEEVLAETQSQRVANEAPTPSVEAADVPDLLINADLLVEAKEYELAKNIYRAVLRTGESSELAYAGLAEVSDKVGLIEQAIQFAWDSVAFKPNERGYNILASVLIQQGRDREAAQALNRSLKQLELTPFKRAEIYKTLGNCYSRLGETAEAETSYKKALDLSPMSDEVQSNLGALYLEQGQIQEAKRRYQDAVAANARNDKAWMGLGLVAVSEADKETALQAFTRALDLNLRNSTAIFHLVKCAYELKKYDQAERILTQYVEVAPVSPSLLYSLAGLQFHVGKKPQALATSQRILKMKSDHSGAKELIQRIESEVI